MVARFICFQADFIAACHRLVIAFCGVDICPPILGIKTGFPHNGVTWPVGRIIRGSTENADQGFERMLQAQKVQKPIRVNTEWLLVGLPSRSWVRGWCAPSPSSNFA